MYLILVLTTVILACVWFKLKRRHLEECARTIPGPPAYPIVGNFYILFGLSNLTDLWKAIINEVLTYAKDKGIMKFWFGTMLSVEVTDADFVEIIAESPHAATKGKFYEMMFDEVLCGAFVVDSGQNWKELRKPITRSISKRLLSKNYFNVFLKRSHHLAEFIERRRLNEEYNIFSDFINHFLDVITETHLGVKMNEVSENKFKYEKNFDTLINLTFRSIMRYHVYGWRTAIKFSRVYKTFKKSKKEIHKLLQWILDERQKEEKKCQEDGVEYYSDFLLKRAFTKNIPRDLVRKELHDIIVGFHGFFHKRGSSASGMLDLDLEIPLASHLIDLSREGARSESCGYLMALQVTVPEGHCTFLALLYRADTNLYPVPIPLTGTDTSAVTACSTLVFLAMFPEVQEKAYQEQRQIFGDSDRDPTPQDLASMSYLWQVVSETLRHVAAPGIGKYLTEDVQLGEYTIPKTTYVYIVIQLIHRDPKHWERPNDFYPEHFSADAEARRHRYAFLPFGCGPRTCPGFLYAFAAIKTTLSTILRKYNLTTSMKFEDISYEFMLMLQMKPGYFLKFTRRKE